MDASKIAIGLRIIFFLAVGISCIANEATAQQRTWTDSSGHYKLKAELVGVTETEAGLQAEFVMEGGKQMAILVTKLCEQDAKLVAKYYADAKKAVEPDAPAKANPETAPPVASNLADPKEDRAKLMPEDSIVSRPLTAPINMALRKLDNRNVADVKFDPLTAIRLDREIKRDEKGRPAENPVYPVEVSEQDLAFLPDKYRRIVDVLRDPNSPIDKKRRSIEQLKTSWPQGRHLGLLKVLINMMSHEDKFLRLAAIDLLANHDSDQSLIYIFARIDDIAFDVRWRTYEVLTQLRDPRVIPELCERLGGPDRAKAASVLQVFGETAAPLVQEWIKEDQKEDVLLGICQLLGNIGDESSARELSKLETHSSLLVRSQAKNSIKRIARRIEASASKSTTRR